MIKKVLAGRMSADGRSTHLGSRVTTTTVGGPHQVLNESCSWSHMLRRWLTGGAR